MGWSDGGGRTSAAESSLEIAGSSDRTSVSGSGVSRYTVPGNSGVRSGERDSNWFVGQRRPRNHVADQRRLRERFRPAATRTLLTAPQRCVRTQAIRRYRGIWSSVIGGSLSSSVERTCVVKNMSGEAISASKSREAVRTTNRPNCEAAPNHIDRHRLRKAQFDQDLTKIRILGASDPMRDVGDSFGPAGPHVRSLAENDVHLELVESTCRPANRANPSVNRPHSGSTDISVCAEVVYLQ